jgi:ribosome-associated heat shock protein Hsp15
MAEEKLRIDKYLWAIRMFKTRTQAANAIEGKKVRMSGSEVKPSKQVAIGDQYEIKRENGDKMLLQVTALLYNRVAYEEAIKHYTNLTPEKDKTKLPIKAFVEQTGKRQSKQGRPTKRNRRDLEGLFE